MEFQILWVCAEIFSLIKILFLGKEKEISLIKRANIKISAWIQQTNFPVSNDGFNPGVN
jgi:hypothetical protein